MSLEDLFKSVLDNDEARLQLLILAQQKPSTLDVRNGEGKTLIYLAAARGFTNMVSMLVDEGCDIDKGFEQDDLTPIGAAAWNGHAETVARLADKCANVNKVTREKRMSPLASAAGRNHVDTVRVLMQHGAHLDVADCDGDTALTLSTTPKTLSF